MNSFRLYPVLLASILVFACNSVSKSDAKINEINSVLKTSGVKAYSYVFSFTGGVLEVKKINNTTQDISHYKAGINDLKFEWNTLESDDPEAGDHEIVISCADPESDSCLSSEKGAFQKIDFEIKGEQNARIILDDLESLKSENK